METQENWLVRTMKAKIATWDARAKAAKRMGNDALFHKASKYKARYESELAKQQIAEKAESVSSQNDIDDSEDDVCISCSLLQDLPAFMGDVRWLTQFRSESTDLFRQALGALNLTDEDLTEMDRATIDGLDELKTCDNCRDMHDQLIAILRDARGFA